MQVATIGSIFLTIIVLCFLVSFGHGLDNALAADSSFVTDDQELVSNASGTPRPAAMYCQELGYEYKAWDFMQGKCGQEYSSCAKCGYGIEDHQRREKSIFTGICCVC